MIGNKLGINPIYSIPRHTSDSSTQPTRFMSKKVLLEISLAGYDVVIARDRVFDGESRLRFDVINHFFIDD